MNNKLELLDSVALLINIPEKHLVKGQVGVIIEIHKDNFYEIEFCDKDGQTIAMLAIDADKLLQLHYDLEAA